MIGLYIAFVLPIILRLRAGESFERGAWNLGKHYKWIDWIAILWIVFICLVFMLPAYQGGIPFKSNFDWNLFNYTPLPVFAAFLLFGGWYVLSARKWFKGPIRQGPRKSSSGSRRRSKHRPRLPPARPRRVSSAPMCSAARKRGAAAVRSSRSKCRPARSVSSRRTVTMGS